MEVQPQFESSGLPISTHINNQPHWKFERMIERRLRTFLEEESIIAEEQEGFKEEKHA